MQHGEEYGGGVYSSPSFPHDHSGNYFGSPPYGSIPPSAPSAPAYGQAGPAINQTNYGNNPSASGYNYHVNPPYNYVSPGSHPSLVDFAPSGPSSATSHSSYPPMAPSYATVGSSYDRSFDTGAGSAPSSADNLDPAGLHQNRSYGGASQRSVGYDPYAPGSESNSSQADQGYGGYVYDQGAGYDKAGDGLSDFGYYGNSGGAEKSYDNEAYSDAFAYDGGNAEPYGARGTGGNSWSSSGNNVSGSYNSSGGKLGSSTKIARATPKSDGESDTGGIQRFRVKLLPEIRSTDLIKDVICQIGLDGVRMVDPNTQRTLRIYPLDTIDKWEVKEPSVFTFWAKSPVDVDQRIIQLKSSNYTTTAILDTLTAACVQLLEIGKGPPSGASVSTKADVSNDPAAVKKGSVLEWMALRPRGVAPAEEKQHWVPDEAVTKCTSCGSDFGAFLRRHHCRNCGDIFCDKCTRGRIALSADDESQPVRVCDRCLAEVTHRLENATRASSKVLAPQRTHEDLAKKLQEEMERSQAGRRSTSATSSSRDGGSRQTSVLNCTKCGSVTLVTGNSGRCSNCGFDAGNRDSGLQKDSNSFRVPADTGGPPHLWSGDTTASNKPGPRMREVACPTCTVHLQVQVPDYGTETVECGVCQHPFLVSA